MNEVILIGRLTKDIELKTLPSGSAVASFSLAVNRDMKNKEGEYETDFISVVAWGKTAEFLDKYCGKGRLISVVGRLQVRKWQATDGTNRTVTEVVAEKVRALDKAKTGNGDRAEAPNTFNGGEPDYPDPFKDD